jgi:hypothetical protein
VKVEDVAALYDFKEPEIIVDVPTGRTITITNPKYLTQLMIFPPPTQSTKPLLPIPPNVLLIQSADSMSGQRKLIPDLTTWMQCFTIYASVLTTKLPQYIPEMLAYSRDIMRASRQCKWSSC